MKPSQERAGGGGDVLPMIACILLTAAYWWGGLAKLSDFGGAVAEMRAFALPLPVPVAAATIALEIGASAWIIRGRSIWPGAIALAIFTFTASILANPFWTMRGIDRFHALNAFLEHVGLIGGLILAAMLSAARRHGP